MKLTGHFNALILAKESRESNGNTYYSLAILQDTQAGTVSCKQHVFESIKEMCPYILGFTYNDQYKSFSVDKVIKDLSVSNNDKSSKSSDSVKK